MTVFFNPQGYELWMGRWSARLAPGFAEFVDLPKSGQFLDVGSGTGVLSAAIVSTDQDARVVGIDPSEFYIELCQTQLGDDRLRFEQGDALDIHFPDDYFDGTLSLLILQELPDAAKALNEMCRVTRPSGCVAASQWNFENGMPMLAMFWDAVIEVINTQSARESAADCMDVDYPDEKALRRLWEDAGLVEVETELQEIEMAFKSFGDYWEPFLTGVSATSSYTQKLNQDEQDVLKEGLREKTIGLGEDRPFTLIAQAWAVKGLVPPV